ncbi:MAG: DUF711 family protein [Chloroflexota bacterium]
MSKKVLRTVTGFCRSLDQLDQTLDEVRQKKAWAEAAGYLVQTHRVCVAAGTFAGLEERLTDPATFCSLGTLSLDSATNQLDDFFRLPNGNFNLDLTAGVSPAHVDLLLRIVEEAPAKTFGFTFVVNNKPGSPYFPSATFGEVGYALGLQSTNLAAGCTTLEEWFNAQQAVWSELITLFGKDQSFLGIDSSVAPIFDGESSLINFVETLAPSFSQAVTSDLFTRITSFLNQETPKPVGLCGLMFPCLEDFELAKAYEKGEFSIERNLFLALHSGLGIDTYPIGINESPARVFEILQLLVALSNKYSKPLSARFVSDGKTSIGARSDFQNQYLADVRVRAL